MSGICLIFSTMSWLKPNNEIEAAMQDPTNWVVRDDGIEHTRAGFCIKHCQRCGNIAWDVNNNVLWWHERHVLHTYAAQCLIKSCKNYKKCI